MSNSTLTMARPSQPPILGTSTGRSGAMTPAVIQSAPVNVSGSPPTHLGHGHEEHLASALHAALRSLSHHDVQPASRSPPTTTIQPPPIHTKEAHSHAKAQTNLDIQVTSDTLVLRGAGVDVEPALLTGNVVLTLSEPTSIRQVTLLFRGKARVPAGGSGDPSMLNTSPTQYIVCSHEWTFLEGADGGAGGGSGKRHSHTLKAGRHLFPFELRLGGALPSSLATYVNGGASIAYKLRATAVRPGLAHTNLTAARPITLLRAFAPETLEYQQTLEIENTWPEKLMYALMLPHKAWAAGDELTALVKFAPLAKGVRVLSVTTSLCETTRTLARGGHLERTRNVVSRKHEIVDGRAVPADDITRRRLQASLRQSLGASGSTSPAYPNAFVSGTSTPVHEAALALSRPQSHHSSASGSSAASSEHIAAAGAVSGSSSGGSALAAALAADAESYDGTENAEISTTLTIALPASLTPSHSLDPVLVNYRVRWSVLLANPDGHTSELRCSLPVHILDYALLDEARAATRQTRRLLFGVGMSAGGVQAPDDGEGYRYGGEEEGEEGAQLPSYPAHIRDRVATVDIALPTGPSSGTQTPAGEYAHASPPAEGFRLHLSGRTSIDAERGQTTESPPEISPDSSRSSSRPESRHEVREPERTGTGGWSFSLSRRTSRTRLRSRAASLEREHHTHTHHPTTTHAVEHPATTTIAPSPSAARPDETHIHASHAASRVPHGLFAVSLRPVTPSRGPLGLGGLGLGAPWAAHAHAAAVTNHFQMQHSRAAAAAAAAAGYTSTPGTGASTPLLFEEGGGVGSAPGLTTSASTSAVPDYFTAARAGARGVPPLESLRDLPTYEDSEAQALAASTVSTGVGVSASSTGGTGASESTGGALAENQRSLSDSDLVARFARAMGRAPAPMQRVR